jgi:hypothetical protein
VLALVLVVGSGRRSVLLRRGLKDDSLELSQRVATQPQDGLKSLAPQLAGVQGPAQGVEGRTLVVKDIVSPRLEQDQVAGSAVGVSHAGEALALWGVEGFGGYDNALVGSNSSEHGRVQQLVCLAFNFVLGHSAGQQHANLGQREDGAALLDHAVSEGHRP